MNMTTQTQTQTPLVPQQEEEARAFPVDADTFYDTYLNVPVAFNRLYFCRQQQVAAWANMALVKQFVEERTAELVRNTINGAKSRGEKLPTEKAMDAALMDDQKLQMLSIQVIDAHTEYELWKQEGDLLERLLSFLQASLPQGMSLNPFPRRH